LVTLERTDIKSTTAILTTLEILGRSTTSIITTLEKSEVKSTTAIYTDLLPSALFSTTAILTTLEANILSRVALLTTLEKTGNNSTVAILTTLEKISISPTNLAILATLEANILSTVAILTTLEADKFSNIAFFTLLEKAGNNSTTSILSTLEKAGNNSTTSILTTLEQINRNTLAIITTLENSFLTSTTAILTTLELIIGSRCAILATLEQTAISTVSIFTSLERLNQTTISVYTILEAISRSKVAIYTDLMLVDPNINSNTSILATLEKANNMSTIGIRTTLEALIPRYWVNQTMVSAPTLGTLKNLAAWNAGGYVLLTPTTQFISGQYEFDGLSIVPFAVEFDIFAGNGTTPGADDIWFYWGCDATPVLPDSTQNGSHVIFSEWLDKIQIRDFVGTGLDQVYSNFDNSTWRQVRLLLTPYNEYTHGTHGPIVEWRVRVYVDNVPFNDASFGYWTKKPGRLYGFASHNGFYTNEHRIRNVRLFEFPLSPSNVDDEQLPALVSINTTLEKTNLKSTVAIITTLSTPRPIQPINETMATAPTSGTIISNASWNAGGYLQLVPETINTTGWYEFSMDLQSDFYVTFDVFISVGGGLNTGLGGMMFYWGFASSPTSEVDSDGGQTYFYSFSNYIKTALGGTQAHIGDADRTVVNNSNNEDWAEGIWKTITFKIKNGNLYKASGFGVLTEANQGTKFGFFGFNEGSGPHEIRLRNIQVIITNGATVALNCDLIANKVRTVALLSILETTRKSTVGIQAVFEQPSKYIIDPIRTDDKKTYIY